MFQAGAGVPDEFEFTLEALAPFAGDEPTFNIGSVIEYVLTVHASNIETDVQVGVKSETCSITIHVFNYSILYCIILLYIALPGIIIITIELIAQSIFIPEYFSLPKL